MLMRSASFLDTFEVVVADTEELREASFGLRHEVYSRELGFEPVRADGLERDAYDERALHYLLAHVPSGEWAACVRIVLAGRGLPFEDVLGSVPLPEGPLGEISRLTVARGFRGGAPSAALGASLTAVAASAEAGLASAVCMMKPSLRRQLRGYGIQFTQLTPLFDYHGRRALFHMAPLAVCRDIAPELQGILGAIGSQIAGAGVHRPAA
jgi:N-acyl-L-homoserine lactone synthetase